MSRRFAAIDIGTVTTRMLVADVMPDGSLLELDREYAITNLGEGVNESRLLKPEAIERVAAAVKRFLVVLQGFEPESGEGIRLRAMTTSAARDARNAGQFVDRLAEIGVTLEVIPGEREAALSFAGASLPFEGERIVVVDVGGGSTEIIAGIAGCSEVVARSFNIGCRRVTEMFLESDPPTAREIDSARRWMREQFAPYLEQLKEQGMLEGRMVAVAGTATTAVSIRDVMEVYDTDRVHLAEVTREQVEDMCARLAAMPLAARRKVIGLDPDRAPVVVAGFLVLLEVMDAGGFATFTVSESDILQGIIADTAR